MTPDTSLRRATTTAREMLMAVAAREGWTVLHDLGLHVEWMHGPRRLAVQFDGDGRCVWCQDGWEHLRPLDSAVHQLIRLTPPRRAARP